MAERDDIRLLIGDRDAPQVFTNVEIDGWIGKYDDGTERIFLVARDLCKARAAFDNLDAGAGGMSVNVGNVYLADKRQRPKNWLTMSESFHTAAVAQTPLVEFIEVNGNLFQNADIIWRDLRVKSS